MEFVVFIQAFRFDGPDSILGQVMLGVVHKVACW
jgi:hypothetical protein